MNFATHQATVVHSGATIGDLVGAIASLKRATQATDDCAEFWYNLGAAQTNLAIQTVPEDETMRVNVMGTYYLLDAARRLGVRSAMPMTEAPTCLARGLISARCR